MAEPRGPRAARVAVAVVFCANGFAFGSWAPRIPQIRDAAGLSTGSLGLALLGFSLGAVAGSMLGGTIISRLGSRRAIILLGVSVGVLLVLPGLARTFWALAISLLVVGVLDGAVDVAMNAHGIVVQRRLARSVMNGLHAAWSFGALLGAFTGSGAALIGIGPAVQLAAVGAGSAVAVLVAGRFLIRGDGDARGGEDHGGTLRWSGAFAVIVVIAVVAAIVEGVPQDWSAVYLTDIGVR